MTVRAPLALAKQIAAGDGVSYGHTWVADDRDHGRPGARRVRRRRAAPRQQRRRGRWSTASGAPIRGRVCMDQFVVDLGGDLPPAGDDVVLFGPGRNGEPTAQDWAEACGTITYEIVTRIGGRLTRARTSDEERQHERDPQVLGRRRGCGRRRRRRRGRAASHSAAAVDRPPRRRRRDAVRLAALRADHGRRRRRRTRCTSRSTSSTGRHRPAATAPPRPHTELTVVFVHGYALNLDCWHFQRAAYRGLVRTVFYDQRSHGRSGRSTDGNATIDQLGRDLLARHRRRRPDGPVVLVGHSMGGMTIVALAEQHPELFGDRVVGVGLISTTAGGLDPQPDPAPRCCRRPSAASWRPALVATLGAAGTGPSTASAGSAAPSRWSPPTSSPSATTCRSSYVEFVDRDALGDAVRGGRGVLPGLRRPRQVRRRRGARRRCRPRSSAAPSDKLTSIGHSRKLHARIAGSTLLECDGAGHMVILERHDQVNAELDQLLAAAGDRVDPGEPTITARRRDPPRRPGGGRRRARGRPGGVRGPTAARPAGRRARRDRGDARRRARGRRRAARAPRRPAGRRAGARRRREHGVPAPLRRAARRPGPRRRRRR